MKAGFKTPVTCSACGTQMWDYLRDVPTINCPRCGPSPLLTTPEYTLIPPGRVVALKVASSQEDLSCQLLNELRELVLSPKYDTVYISTVLGVIRILEDEMMGTLRS